MRTHLILLFASLILASCAEDTTPPDLFVFDKDDRLVDEGGTVYISMKDGIGDSIVFEFVLARVFIGDETNIDLSYSTHYIGTNEVSGFGRPFVSREIIRENERDRSAMFEFRTHTDPTWQYQVNDTLDILVRCSDKFQNLSELNFYVVFVE
jgi:hypothetical protein